jgi:hypothetical protein
MRLLERQAPVKLFAMIFLGVAPVLAGCVSEEAETEAEDLGATRDEINILNALEPDALVPSATLTNALAPNTLAANALTLTAMSAGALAAIQARGSEGDLSRAFLRYAVGCAFTSSQSFQFSWTDAQGATHAETYQGEVGLAPGWAAGSLSQDGQKLVTACMAARSNHYGAVVMISARHPSISALSASSTEQLDSPILEGAFWGNLFATTPQIYSCYTSANIQASRDQQRVCAAGYLTTSGTAFCDYIVSRGDCSVVCQEDDAETLGYASCGTATNPTESRFAITTYLAD